MRDGFAIVREDIRFRQSRRLRPGPLVRRSGESTYARATTTRLGEQTTTSGWVIVERDHGFERRSALTPPHRGGRCTRRREIRRCFRARVERDDAGVGTLEV